MYKQEIGYRLKLLREQSGHTQEEIAQKLGINRSSLTRYENGERVPKANELISLSKLYNTTIDYILTGSKIKEHNMLEMFENVSNITGLSIKAVMVLYLLKRGTLKGVEETKSTEKLEFISEMIENFGKE